MNHALNVLAASAIALGLSGCLTEATTSDDGVDTSPALLSAGGPTTGDFRVTVAGDSRPLDVVAVDMDPIEIDVRDTTQGSDTQWRAFKSGMPRFGNARVTFRMTDSVFSGWLNDAKRGLSTRKTLTVTLLASNGDVARTYNLVETFPISFSGPMTCGATGCIMTVALQVGGVELKLPTPPLAPATATGTAQSLRYKGYNVEIRGVAGVQPASDGNWTSVSGGEKATEVVEASVGSDPQRRFTPGKAYVTDLTLVGYMTPTRRAFEQWIASSTQGTGDLRADLSISSRAIDGSPGCVRRYTDAIISRIEFPQLKAGSSDPVQDVIVVNAGRVEAGQGCGAGDH